MLLRRYSCSFEIFLLILTLHCSDQSLCQKPSINTTPSPTKCVAGRILYENWSKIPGEKTKSRPTTPPSWLAVVTSTYAGVQTVCSGVLINDRYVLTAQRCVLPPLEPRHINVTLTSLEFPLSDIMLHPNFDENNTTTSHNDVALLKLQSALHFTSKLFPLQLVANNDIFAQLSSTSTLTFGLSPNEFLKFRGALMRRNVCKRFNQYYNYALETRDELLCSKISRDNHGDCFNLQGMIGAALVMEKQKRIYRIDVLIGILTWWWPKNRHCTALENPFVFVNVQSKLAWIVNKTNDARYCRY